MAEVMWRVRVTYGDRLLLIVATEAEAELFFRRRVALFREHGVRHLECWIYSAHFGVKPGFTADLDEADDLHDNFTDPGAEASV